MFRSPSDLLDLAAAQLTIYSPASAQLNATSIDVSNWGEMCAWAFTPELDALIKIVTKAVQAQSGVAFPVTGVTAESLSGQGRASERLSCL